MNRSIGAVPQADLYLTPELIEQLALEARYAHEEALAEKLRELAAAKARAEDMVPEVVRRLGEEHAYLLAQGVANALFGLAAFVGRLVRAVWAMLFHAPEGGQLVQPLGSIRTLAEVLRDNPKLSAEERARMLGIIVEQSERFERLVGALLKAPSRA